MISQEEMKFGNRSEAGSSGNGHEERDSLDISETESIGPKPESSNLRDHGKSRNPNWRRNWLRDAGGQ